MSSVPPTSTAGPRSSSSRGIAGGQYSYSTVPDYTVTIEREMQAVILADDEVQVVGMSLAEKLAKTGNDWRTEIDLAKDLPEQLATMKKIIKEFGWKGSAYVTKINGKSYVVLKGYAGLRSVFQGTKYLADNAKIISYGIGKQGSKLIKGNLVSIIILSAFNVIETIVSEDKDFIDATAQFTTDVVKTIAAGVAGAALGAVATAFSAPVIVVVGTVAVVGIVTALILDQIDAKFGITSALSDWLRDAYEDAAKGLREQTYEFERQWRWCDQSDNIMVCMEALFGG